MNDFSVSMALVDYIPVIFFAIASVILMRDLYNKMSKGAFALFAGGTIFVTCAGATLMMFIFEDPAWAGISAAKLAILYSGVMSAAAGYTLQILGQKHTPAALASLLMSLESVFAVVASAILLPEITTFSWREVVGMLIIFLAIICSQLNLDFKKSRQTV